jgi:hypothetical protein
MKKLLATGWIIYIQVIASAQQFNTTAGVYFQPGISDRLVKMTNELPAYNEKPDMGWEGGLTACYYYSEWFHVQSGICISKKSYKLNLKAGDLIFPEEPEDPMLVDLVETTSHCEFYYVSMPLYAGINVFQNRTFTTGIRSGLSLDYHLKSIIRNENIYRNRTENEVIHPEIPGLRKFNLTGSFSLFLSYNLTEKYELSVEPVCTISLLPVVDNSEINARFMQYGIRAGVQYKF